MLKRRKNTYSLEFRIEAASLVLDKGLSYPEACRTMNVAKSTLYSWVMKLKAERLKDDQELWNLNKKDKLIAQNYESIAIQIEQEKEL